MNFISKNDFIKTFPYFKTTPESLVLDILSKMQLKNIEKGQILFNENDRCTGIGFLLEGEIRVYKSSENAREITLYSVSDGEICILNAACILSDIAFPAYAVAIFDSRMLFISSINFKALMDKYPEFRKFILMKLTNRLIDVIQLVEEVLFRKLDERLIEYLKEKADSNIIKMTHQKIADDLGTSREVVSRLLKDFEVKNKIVLSRSEIRLL